MTKQCALVRDLLPLYEEQLTSEESNEFIRTHLAACPECQAYFANGAMVLPHDDVTVEVDDMQLVRAVKRRIGTWLIAALGFGVVLGSLFLTSFAVSVVLLVMLLVVLLARTKASKRAPSKKVWASLTVVSLVCFVIALHQFYRLAVYSDRGGKVLAFVGGEFWLYMSWLQIGLLFSAALFTGWRLVKG